MDRTNIIFRAVLIENNYANHYHIDHHASIIDNVCANRQIMISEQGPFMLFK